MAVTVTPQSGLKVNVGLGAARVVTTQTTSARVGTSLDDLSSVDTSGVQDGYTLVYDTTVNKWVSQVLTAAAPTTIDGGTF